MNSNNDDDVPPPMCPNETRTNLIINHLPNKLTDEEFHSVFSVVGEIKSLRIMKDLKTGASYGFGFVEYIKPESAAIAILQLNNYSLHNKRLKVSYAQPPGQETKQKENNLYVQNIPPSYTEEDLYNLFCPYGNIEQKLIFKDKITGHSRGFGFVKFTQSKEAYAAIQGMNGRIPEDGSKPLMVKIAGDRNTDSMHGRGRGRGHFNNRGSNHSMGQSGAFMMHSGEEEEFAHPTGKIGQGRVSNRYNPIGSGGGYASDPNFALIDEYGPNLSKTLQPRTSTFYEGMGGAGRDYRPPMGSNLMYGGRLQFGSSRPRGRF